VGLLEHVRTLTPTYAVFCKSTTGSLYAISSAGALTTDATPAAATINDVVSKYVEGGSDEFIMIAGSAGIEYSTTGISGTWNTPTTAPTDTLTSLVWAGGAVFYGVAVGGTKLWKTIDSGDNWTSKTITSDVDVLKTSISYNEKHTRLILGGTGNDANHSIEVSYSDDDGDNWTTSTWDRVRAFTNSADELIYGFLEMGGSIVFAFGGMAFGDTTHDTFGVLSVDGGASWSVVSCKLDRGAKRGCASATTDGKSILASSDHEEAASNVIFSLSNI